MLAFGGSSPLYQAYQGKGADAKSVISLIDVVTGEIYAAYISPDEFKLSE